MMYRSSVLGIFTVVTSLAFAMPNPIPLAFFHTQYIITAHQHISPNAFDFWREAQKLGDKLVHYTNEQLEAAATTYASATEKIGQFKVTMENVVSDVKRLADDVRRDGIDLEEFSEKLSVELSTIMEELKKEFSEPLPSERTARQDHRDSMINHTLSKVEDAVVKVTGLWGVSKTNSRAYFQKTQPSVESVLVIAGKLIDEHPVLLETIIFAGAAMIIPEGWFLRPILSLFGFGPKGPVKGSAAAWAQRTFWGKAVTAKSWFSRLQSAGMTVKTPGFCKTAASSLAIALGVTATGWSMCSGICR